ncbi:MAG TPA: Gfo/Idh/MocA family oxidoreductase [Herpetosiphonaceae bacterium]
MQPDLLLPPGERLGWAIVGLGDFACNQILPSFAACGRSKVTAVVSGDRAKAERVARQYGVPAHGVYTYETFDQIRDNPDVDVVYIILPNSMHAEYTIRAAQAGKHVMCEKPMAPTVEECRRMIDACREADRKLMLGYRAHFEPHNLEAQRLLREGAIGDLKLIVADHARLLDPKQPQDRWRTQHKLAGGGSLVDIGIYSLNAARWFTGEEPAGIQATQYSTPGDSRFREVEESISFVLRFPGGVIANCLASYGVERCKRYRLLGSEGWLDLDPATEYHGNRLVVGTAKGREERIVEAGNQFAREIDHLSQCVQEGREPETDGQMGLRDVELIQAIYQAARGTSGEQARER